MSTYREVMKSAITLLQLADIDEPDTDARALLMYLTGMTLTKLMLSQDRIMPAEEQESYVNLVTRRCGRIPLQHLTGVQCFYGLDIQVNGNVLIPRPETELLVETALKCIRALGNCRPDDRRHQEQVPDGPDREPALADGASQEAQRPPEILDMCTGSGCILLALLHQMPCIHGTGADLSGEALAMARANAARLGVDACWIQSDLFSQVSGHYDLIVSNPPYIRHGDLAGLQPEVRLYDPQMALDGGEDGLTFYRILAQESPAYLNDGGWLILEIGADQAQDVTSLLRDAGFVKIGVRQDLNGLDRVVSALWKNADS